VSATAWAKTEKSARADFFVRWLAFTSGLAGTAIARAIEQLERAAVDGCAIRAAGARGGWRLRYPSGWGARRLAVALSERLERPPVEARQPRPALLMVAKM